MWRQSGHLTSFRVANEKNMHCHTLKMVKADFIQEQRDSYWDRYNGILQVRGREIGANSKYSMEKWEFIAKEQGKGVSDEKLLRGNTGGKYESFWLKWPVT